MGHYSGSIGQKTSSQYAVVEALLFIVERRSILML